MGNVEARFSYLPSLPELEHLPKRVSYQLEPGESLNDGLLRILDEQAALGTSALRDVSRADDDAVHAARVCIKRIRAVLLLLRRELGRENHEKEDRRWAEIAGTLSTARDAEVVTHAMREVANDPVCQGDGARMLELLVASRFEDMDDLARLRPDVATRIECAGSPFSTLVLTRVRPGTIRDSLRRAYAECRRYRVVPAELAAETLHDWRKSTKHVVYQLRLFQHFLDRRLRRRQSSLEELADLLGRDRDYALLDTTLKEAGSRAGISSVALTPALHAIAARRREFQDEARHLAVVALADRPKAHVERLMAKYESARRTAG